MMAVNAPRAKSTLTSSRAVTDPSPVPKTFTRFRQEAAASLVGAKIGVAEVVEAMAGIFSA